MPFRHPRRPADPVQIAQQRIAAPLARLEERLVSVSSNLDTLVTGLEEVALQIRQMAQQATEQTGECDE